MLQSTPMSFAELIAPGNLTLFSAVATSLDFLFYSSSLNFSLSEAEEEEAESSSKRCKACESPLSSDSSFGAVLLSSSGARLLNLFSKAEKERDELKEENVHLKEEVVALKERLGES